jgi:hypothetical protein
MIIITRKVGAVYNLLNYNDSDKITNNKVLNT